MEEFTKILEILIAAIKSGVAFMFFSIRHTSTSEAGFGYFIAFASLFAGGILGVYWIGKLILDFLETVIMKFFGFLGAGFKNFWDLFQRKEKIVTKVADVDYNKIAEKIAAIEKTIESTIQAEVRKINSTKDKNIFE